MTIPNPPDDNRPLERRIMDAYPNLTPSERKLADVMRRHQKDITSYTAEELAAQAGVSKATAARLIKILGYRSYPEAKRMMRSEPNWGSPLAVPPPQTVDLDKQRTTVMADDLGNVQWTLDALDSDTLAEVTSMLAAAPAVWVAGLRNGQGVAFIARHYLTLLRQNVHALSFETGSLSFDLSHLKAGDVLFLVSFRRQPKMLEQILHSLHARGIVIILVTDNSSRNERDTVSHTLYIWNFSHSPFNSFTAAVSMLHLIAASLHARLGDRAQSRFVDLEDLTGQLDEVFSLDG